MHRDKQGFFQLEPHCIKYNNKNKQRRSQQTKTFLQSKGDILPCEETANRMGKYFLATPHTGLISRILKN